MDASPAAIAPRHSAEDDSLKQTLASLDRTDVSEKSTTLNSAITNLETLVECGPARIPKSVAGKVAYYLDLPKLSSGMTTVSIAAGGFAGWLGASIGVTYTTDLIEGLLQTAHTAGTVGGTTFLTSQALFTLLRRHHKVSDEQAGPLRRGLRAVYRRFANKEHEADVSEAEKTVVAAEKDLRAHALEKLVTDKEQDVDRRLLLDVATRNYRGAAIGREESLENKRAHVPYSADTIDAATQLQQSARTLYAAANEIHDDPALQERIRSLANRATDMSATNLDQFVTTKPQGYRRGQHLLQQGAPGLIDLFKGSTYVMIGTGSLVQLLTLISAERGLDVSPEKIFGVSAIGALTCTVAALGKSELEKLYSTPPAPRGNTPEDWQRHHDAMELHQSYADLRNFTLSEFGSLTPEAYDLLLQGTAIATAPEAFIDVGAIPTPLVAHQRAAAIVEGARMREEEAVVSELSEELIDSTPVYQVGSSRLAQLQGK